MAKRFIDTELWKNQRWFKKLLPIYKLGWMYITTRCDHAGILKWDVGDLMDDLGVESFNLPDFLAHCNTDFDKDTGEKVVRERIVRIAEKNILWITGFIKFQYETKELVINISVPAALSALKILHAYDLFDIAIERNFITLAKGSEPFRRVLNSSEGLDKGSEPFGTVKDKDRDKDKDKDKEEKGVEKKILKIETKFLVPEMLKIFTDILPGYPVYDQKDFAPLCSIAHFIQETSKINGNAVENKDIILKKWEALSLIIAGDEFYNKKSLSVISNQIQSIHLLQKNGKQTRKVKNTGGSIVFDEK